MEEKYIMKQRIHVFGASGSGTTTIAKIACDKLAFKHFDSDSYFWQHTEEPFTIERPRDECLRLMNNDLSNNDKWILSGSIANWGNILIPYFDLVIFVYVPQDIRLERLKKRELERYGDKVFPGGGRYYESKSFLEWAASYEIGTMNGRTLQKHEAWLTQIECTSLKIINNSLDDSVTTVLNAIQNSCT